MKIIRIENQDNALMEIAKYIRCEVFVKEQNVPFEEDWDEEESENYLIYDNNKPVGTMRWRDIGDKIKIERVAVLSECRGKGIASLLLKHVIEEIKSQTDKPITFNSQLLAIPLYERLGFKQYGELFYEADIPHYAMNLEK